MDVLTEEQAELAKLKKELPVEDLKTIEKLQQEVKKVDILYVNLSGNPLRNNCFRLDLKQLDDLRNKVGRFGVSCAFEAKADIQKKIANNDYDEKHAAHLTKVEIPV